MNDWYSVVFRWKCLVILIELNSLEELFKFLQPLNIHTHYPDPRNEKCLGTELGRWFLTLNT